MTILGSGAVKLAVVQADRSRPRLMSGRGPPRSGGRDGAKRKGRTASRQRTAPEKSERDLRAARQQSRKGT